MPVPPRNRFARVAAAFIAAAAVSTVAIDVAAQGNARAQPGSTPSKTVADPGPSWASLTPAQRRALAPLERDWSTIDAPRKAKWLEIATKLPTMPPDEQRRMQERMSEWARMTPTERGQARLSFQEAKQLSPQERQARWEAYQALPAEDRQALADRARPRTEPPKPGASAPLVAVPKQSVHAGAPRPGTGVKPIAPTMVQVQPGATTTMINKTPTPPAPARPGPAKIEAQPNQVNRTTLLPQPSRATPPAVPSTPGPAAARDSAAAAASAPASQP